MTGHIIEAIQRWADDIAALGGGEPLTRFREAKVGTIDLSTADDPARKQLLDGEPVRVSRLFPHDPLRTSASRSASRLADRLWRLEAGHGIAAGYLATGLASWNDPVSTRRPNAPVLLRRLQVAPVGFAEPDLLLHVVGEPELNPRLLAAMADQLGLRLTPDDLLDPSGYLRYPVVVDRLREQAPPHVVDGFAIAHRAVIGLMTTVVEDVVTDLRQHAEVLSTRPFVALAAGSGAASLGRATSTQPRSGEMDVQDAAPAPIDLDSVQRRVLDAVRTASSVAVEAPAGTGATQVAAGLCADAVAAGRSVLVVAESTPRLHGLRRRLASIGMGGATLDLADGLLTPPGLARDVLSTVDSVARRGGADAVEPTVTPGLDAAATERDRVLLAGYATALHEHRHPRALSAYQAISAAHGGTSAQRCDVRLGAQVLAGLDADTLDRLRDSLAEFIEAEGLVISGQATAWFGAQPASREDAEQAVAVVDRLRTALLPAARDTAARAAAEVGMPAPTRLDDVRDLTALLDDVHRVEQVFTRAVWAEPVDRMAAATADRRHRRMLDDGPGLRERRALRQQSQALAHPQHASDLPVQAEALTLATDVLARWAHRARDGRLPRTGDTSAAAVAAWAEVTQALDALHQVHPTALPDELDLPGVAARLAALAGEAHWARRLPRLTATATELADHGLGPVVAELRSRREAGEPVTPESAVAVLDTCVAASLAADIESSDPVLSKTDGAVLREAGERWRQADAAAIVASADAARAAWAARVARASTDRPVQVRALRDCVAASRPTSMRALLAESWSTVVAARPIWLGGPLPMAAALPLDASFDLVVVLDAQAVSLAHSVGVLARAQQVVVLGDPAQLPPSPTPLSLDAPDPRAAPAGPGAALETPSVYAVLRDQLPTVDLVARYGCRDARLEMAMPARPGGASLAVTPGSSGTPPLRLHHVQQEPGTRDQEESVRAEVQAVVDLVRAHVAGQSSASLAVLTLGRTHADAVRAALARACLTDASLAEALGPEADEPFVLCPIEDLHGERRDAVILSVGYGRTMDGRLLYRYGPIHRPGGARWLSAAVSTARRDLAVVTSVTASDLEPRRLAADGLRALRQLLASAEGLAIEGVDDPATHPAVTPRPLDPLERSIAERLHQAGLPVTAGSGAGWLGTAMALEHPGRPGRGVLVVETEGGPFGELHHLRDRERMRPEQLMRAGWSVHRVSAVDWLRNPDAEVDGLRTAWRQACALADAVDAARNAPARAPAGPDESGAREPAGRPESAPDRRPLVAVGRHVDAYPAADLVALAAWVQTTSPNLDEDQSVAALGHEVGLAHPAGRTERVLRHAVRAASIAARPELEVPEALAQAAPEPPDAPDAPDAPSPHRCRRSAGPTSRNGLPSRARTRPSARPGCATSVRRTTRAERCG